MIAGGCLCGAVRYETDADPIMTRLCWCRVCQFIATGNAAVSVCFPSSGMSISGEPRDFVSVGRQRQPHAPAFLPDLRDASVQRSRIAAAPDLRAGRLSGRPRDCPACRGDLDGARAVMGLRGRKPPELARPASANRLTAGAACADSAADRYGLELARLPVPTALAHDEKETCHPWKDSRSRSAEKRTTRGGTRSRESATPNSNPLPVRP